VTRPELLAPAGSPECVAAAVQNGADAVYLGLGAFNCRRGATNFTPETLRAAADYCHERGVRVYVTLNTLVTDREIPDALETLEQAVRGGADALLVQDWGLAKLCREAAPELPLHASTQMGVADLDGVRQAAAMGCTRAVLARETSREELRRISAESPIELEIFVHGALCMCYSGHCYLSAVLGRRSGNRGLCAQPCRLPYGFGARADGAPLSLRDMSLAGHMKELTDLGISCLKIEGRMKRPEYVAAVTRVYRAALDEQRDPTPEEVQMLTDAFSRQGFTDGYWTGRRGKTMFGVREEPDPARSAALYRQVRPSYAPGAEQPRTQVSFEAQLRTGVPARLTVSDGVHQVTVTGPAPEPARSRSLTAEELETRLKKTGGTPYLAGSTRAQVDDGLMLSASAINDLRRRALAALSQARKDVPISPILPVSPLPETASHPEAPALTAQLSSFDQLSEGLLQAGAAGLLLPVEELASHPEKTQALLDRGVSVTAVLPRFAAPGEERDLLEELLSKAASLGVRDALVGNPGMLAPARRAGMALHGDFGLGVMNSRTLWELKEQGFESATASFELSFPQLRDLKKYLPTAALVYGRLPLMIFRNCAVNTQLGRCACGEGKSLVDRKGARFPIRKAFGCRNELLNSQPLYLADRREDYLRLGLSEARLLFTTETAEEVLSVFRAYQTGAPAPERFTRGLYTRGVE